jgi:hypothetical protein
MADDFQIRRTFQDLGTLFAAEHHEGDDEGVQQVQGLVAALRKFKQHEDKEHGRMAVTVREAAYQTHDGRAVFYDDGRESLRDAADLYAVLEEQHGTGSPNVENLQAMHILGRLQTGEGLGAVHVGTLRGLLNRHAKAVSAHRKNRDGQDLLAMASAGSDSRIIGKGEAY